MSRRVIFLIFFISGYCGLLYQVVWVRLAFSSFGIITPVLSVVLAVFMSGLGIGSLAAGRRIKRRTSQQMGTALRWYACSEFMIGIGAFTVPRLFHLGETLLLFRGEMQSTRYLAGSAFLLALSLFPWCLCMGFTYPLMMETMKEQGSTDKTSFSYLYLANTLSAMAGALMSAFVWIELFGLKNTLVLAGVFNFVIAAYCYWQASQNRGIHVRVTLAEEPDRIQDGRFWISTILVVTALIAMSSEVIWTRDFTPLLGTTVYAFASIVTVYLLATWIGSYLYRRQLAERHIATLGHLLALISVAAFLPIILNNPVFGLGAVGALASFFPFCALLGYLTPFLIDLYSQGSPEKAGTGYAFNVAGCVLGPLLASYIFLPFLGARLSMLVMTLPLYLLFIKYSTSLSRPTATLTHVLCLGLVLASLFSISYEEACSHPTPHDRIKRDYAATVLCCGEGWHRDLLVNGTGMSRLTFVTKEMAHLPLACYPGKAQSALLICFGMGTTYRSLLSWNVRTTAVELVPSVPKVFSFFFNDAETVVRNPLGTLVVDDGRRFLKRTRETFDVITIDPPPLVEASGSGLLYSMDFYSQVKAHLTPNGIFQQWWPGGEERILQAVARSLAQSFPYVRVYKGRGKHGFHFLASNKPLRVPSAREFAARLPPGAAQDIREWVPGKRLEMGIQAMIAREIPLARMLPPDRTAVITDDHPYNEYYFLRRVWDWGCHQLVFVN